MIALSLQPCHAGMLLTSPDFVPNRMIPGDFGCDLYDHDLVKPSPGLFWTRPPSSTKSFVLLVEDMTVDRVHWLVTDIPQNLTFLLAGATGTSMPEGSKELRNGFGFIGFAGFCPPQGEVHDYRFRLFAMNRAETKLDLPIASSKLRASMVSEQLADNTLYCSVLFGSYFCGEGLPPGHPGPGSNGIPGTGPSSGSGPRIGDAIGEDGILGWEGSGDGSRSGGSGNDGSGKDGEFDHHAIGDGRVPCIVPIPEGATCPCPGPDCPIPPVTLKPYAIRFVKPSESLKPHGTNFVVNHVNASVTEAICDESSPAKDLSRAQIVQSVPPPPPKVAIAAPNSMVEDAPILFQRHQETSGPVVFLQNPEAQGFSSKGAAHFADDEADMVAEGIPEPAAHGGDELEWGDGLESEDLIQEDFEIVGAGGALQPAAASEPSDGSAKVPVSKCIDRKTGCKRIRRIKRYGFTAWSPAHATGENASISIDYMCRTYSNRTVSSSIPLAWRHAPEKTRSFIVLFEDVTNLEEEGSGKILWLLANIPTSVNMITEASSGTTALPVDIRELIPYRSPCPSRQVRVSSYRVRVMALAEDSVELKLSVRDSIRDVVLSDEIDRQVHPLVTASMQFNHFNS